MASSFSATQEDYAGNLSNSPSSSGDYGEPDTESEHTVRAGNRSFPLYGEPEKPDLCTWRHDGRHGFRNSTIPYLQQYNLSIEQQIGNNWSAQVAYVGSMGHHFYVLRDENAPVYVPGASTSSAGINTRRPIQPYAGISLWDTSSSSAFNSFQATSRAASQTISR